jgi:hypothetical protein
MRRILSEDQKQNRLLVCQELKDLGGSPDLAPCDFFLFPKMKIQLKGRRFETIEEIQAESQVVLDRLTKKDFQ